MVDVDVAHVVLGPVCRIVGCQFLPVPLYPFEIDEDQDRTKPTKPNGRKQHQPNHTTPRCLFFRAQCCLVSHCQCVCLFAHMSLSAYRAWLHRRANTLSFICCVCRCCNLHARASAFCQFHVLCGVFVLQRSGRRLSLPCRECSLPLSREHASHFLLRASLVLKC